MLDLTMALPCGRTSTGTIFTFLLVLEKHQFERKCLTFELLFYSEWRRGEYFIHPLVSTNGHIFGGNLALGCCCRWLYFYYQLDVGSNSEEIRCIIGAYLEFLAFNFGHKFDNHRTRQQLSFQATDFCSLLCCKPLKLLWNRIISRMHMWPFL